MTASRRRPVHLDLLRIRLPIGGVVSILHRISGVVLVLLLPLGLYLLQYSLQSAAAYQRVLDLFRSLPARLLVVLVVAIAAQHLFSGIRHLLLDIDVGVTRAGGRRGAWLTLLATGIVAALMLGAAL